jgi:hypothetical protein
MSQKKPEEQRYLDMLDVLEEKMLALSEAAIEEINELKARIEFLERKKTGASIQKLEGFNGEELPPVQDNTRMNDWDKLASIRNAIKILPPNLIVDGRHLASNIEAICGFKVSEEMLDAAYEEKA